MVYIKHTRRCTKTCINYNKKEFVNRSSSNKSIHQCMHACVRWCAWYKEIKVLVIMSSVTPTVVCFIVCYRLTFSWPAGPTYVGNRPISHIMTCVFNLFPKCFQYKWKCTSILHACAACERSYNLQVQATTRKMISSLKEMSMPSKYSNKIEKKLRRDI